MKLNLFHIIGIIGSPVDSESRDHSTYRKLGGRDELEYLSDDLSFSSF